jgi:hypothetical protein
MFTYVQVNGHFAKGGVLIATGYSGHGEGVNNPCLQETHAIGPIPVGLWRMGEAVEHPELGPLAIPLTACDGTQTFGRGGFFVHGDEVKTAGQELASHGCIILGKAARQMIEDSDDKLLQVV